MTCDHAWNMNMNLDMTSRKHENGQLEVGLSL